MLTDEIKNGKDIPIDDGNITIVNGVSLVEKEKENKEEITPDVKIPQAEEVVVQASEESSSPSAPIIPTIDTESVTATPQIETPIVPSVEAPVPDTNLESTTISTGAIDTDTQGFNYNDSINVYNNDTGTLPDFSSNTFSNSNVPSYANTTHNSNKNVNTGFDFNMNNQNGSYTMSSSNFNNPLEEINSFVNSLIEVIKMQSTWSNTVADNGYVNRQSIEELTEINSKVSNLGIEIPVNSNTRRF